jgi:hypothetical protein
VTTQSLAEVSVSFKNDTCIVFAPPPVTDPAIQFRDPVCTRTAVPEQEVVPVGIPTIGAFNVKVVATLADIGSMFAQFSVPNTTLPSRTHCPVTVPVLLTLVPAVAVMVVLSAKLLATY